MKKRIFMLVLTCLCLFSLAFSITRNKVFAEGEQTSYSCSVVIEKSEHGTIEADILEGNVGDLVTIQVSPSLFYKISNVCVNNIVLQEDENTSGKYMFVLSEGENKITANFVVDEETLGDLSTIYEEAVNKDWDNLFSVDTIVTIVKWVLDCGILIAIVRYFIKDKKLESKVENAVKETVSKIIPDTTKDAVVEKITPIVEEQSKQLTNVQEAVSTFAKCLALSQENSAEAKLAILNALSGLELGDKESVAKSKEYIEETVQKLNDKYNATMEALEKIEEENKAEIIDEPELEQEQQEEVVEDNGSEDNGTVI